ncbi:MAG: hypothetical protein JXA33_27355, partial [Anaerolineae bacterium]|nr:hypothetical protein [Anaerolineae bacterium]
GRGARRQRGKEAEAQGSGGAREQEVIGITQSPKSRITYHASRITYHVSRITFYILLLWLIFGTLRIFPYELTFFNDLAGGPENGWRFLAASNTDWRQSWKALRDWQQVTGISFYGPDFKSGVTPEYYGISYTSLASNINGPQPISPVCLYPPAGDYVIRTQTLSTFAIPYLDNYAWFRYHAPTQIIANSLFYYHVPDPVAPIWLAQCSLPSPPLSESVIAGGFGGLTPRALTFDCTQTWIYPNGGTATGWYTLHDQLLQPDTLWNYLYLRPSQPVAPFIARHLAGIPQSFRQWDYHETPAFAAYEWGFPDSPQIQASQMLPSPAITVGYPARAEAIPTSLVAGATVQTPIALEGPLTFLGTGVYVEEETFVLETWWQVTESAIRRPFSLMAHLLTTEGAVVEVGDGLGISPFELQAGDVLVQRHSFPNANIHSQTDPLWLRTGAYWSDNATRWPLDTAFSEADAIFIPLEIPR